MGRLYVTNNKEWSIKINNIISTSGFNYNGIYQNENCFLRTYSKLKVETVNYYSDKEGFLAVCGTLIYKNEIGYNMVKHLYDDMKLLPLSEIRKEIMGCYIVSFMHNNIIKTFVDEAGIYACYYTNAKSYFITNSYYYIEKCTKQEINIAGAMDKIISTTSLNNETPFKNIYRLMGDEMIEINLVGDTFKIVNLPIKEYAFNNTETDMDILAELIKKYSMPQAIFGGRNILFGTGGVDSRLVLAGDLAVGIRPELVSWYGKSESVDNDNQDRDIWESIAKNNHLEFSDFDISNIVTQTYDELSLNRYGEHALIYSNNQSWFRFFEELSNCTFINCGMFGERFKSWSINNGKKISIDKFIDIYLEKGGLEIKQISFNNSNVYREEHIKKMFGNVLGLKNYESQLSSSDIENIAETYWSLSSSYFVNYFNLFTYSYSPIGQAEIISYLMRIDYEKKINKKISISIINKLYPKLLETEFFVTRQYVKLNLSQMKLEPLKKVNNHIYILKKSLKTMLEKNRIGKLVINKYRRMKYGKKQFKDKLKWVNLILETDSAKIMNLQLNEYSLVHLEHYIATYFFLCMLDNGQRKNE